MTARHQTSCSIVLTAFAALIVTTHAVEPGKPSVSALEVTAYRAIGAKHRDPAIRNGDTLAERFLGPDEREVLKNAGSEGVLRALTMDTDAAWASLGVRRPFAEGVHMRTRHIDEVFEDSVKAGATQAVILGAGLDSRAYRFQNILRNARVFEVDFPATQEYKKLRVREIVGSLPSYVSYVPIDFTKDDLATVLADAGYDASKKTIFVWEGVTFYIPEEAVDATLRFVARRSATGSRIVFDYFVRSALKAPSATLKDIMNRLEAVREPLIFGIPDNDRAGFITSRGLRIVSDVNTGALRSRYLPRVQTPQPPTPTGNYICTAAVP